MTQKQNQKDDQSVSDGDRLYDAIMEVIEPDLTIAVFPTLDEKYKSESEDEREHRIDRYEEALDIVAELFDRLDYLNAEDVRERKKTLEKQRKVKEEQERESSVEHAEEQIESISDDS